MIKADVKVTGTVKRNAAVKTNRNGQPYLSFIMTVAIPDAKEEGKSGKVDILVTRLGAGQADAAALPEKTRACVEGRMDIRTREGRPAFYLSADGIRAAEPGEGDGMTGTLHFRGRLKNDGVAEVRTDRKGNKYLFFSAFSSEKTDDGFVTTWVRFFRFPRKGAEDGGLMPGWMRPKARLSADGALSLSAYGDAVRLSCRVEQMEEYEWDGQ